MNCAHFRDQWPSFLSGLLSEDELAELAAHVKTCQHCRRCWDDHHEARKHLTAMIQLKDGTKIARTIEREVGTPVTPFSPANKSGAMNPSQSTDSAPSSSLRVPHLKSPSASVLAGVLFGILLGIVGTRMFSGGGSVPAGISRMIELEMMLDGRMPRSARNAMMSQTLGTGMGSSLFGSLPRLTEATKTVLCVIVIAGMARTKAWESVFGSAVPRSVRFARVLSWLVIVLGGVIAIGTLYVQSRGLPAMISGRRNMPDIQLVMSAHGVAMEIWSLGCWLTIACVLLGAAQGALRNSSR